MLHEHFRQALIDSDVDLLWKLWAHANPHLPQPKDREEAESIMHLARSESAVMPFDRRAYSHAWLMERGFPSRLPDHLRPAAQRMYPVTLGVVGIALGGSSELAKAIKPTIARVMSDSVMESYADGKTDPPFVKGRMLEARDKEMVKLIGKLKCP